MERPEVQDLLAMVQGTFPNFNPPNKTVTVNAWHMALKEYSKDDVANAFLLYVRSDSSGFAPTPGQIIEKMSVFKQYNEPSEMEVWSMVSKAIRNSGYHAEEEFAKLPPLAQKAVGSASQLEIWAKDTNYNESVICSHFISTYRVQKKRQDEFEKLPENIKTLLLKISPKKSIEGDA